MKRYMTPMNFILVFSFLIGFTALVFTNTETSLFLNLFGGMSNDELFIWNTILFWGFLYLKYVQYRHRKTKHMHTYLLWLLAPILAILTDILIFLTDSIAVIVLLFGFLLLLALTVAKVPIKKVLFNLLTYLGLCVACFFLVGSFLFFYPARSYEVYERNGITYVHSYEQFLVQEWNITYEMTSPITMKKVSEE